MQWFRTSLDNPNYFDVENGLTSPKTPTENRGSGFFIFRKRTSSSNKQSPKSAIGNYNNVDTSVLGKRRGSLKNLLRSRSNSASINKLQDNNNLNATCKNFESVTPTSSFSFHSNSETYNESNTNNATDDVFYSQTSDNKFYSLSHNSNQSKESSANARRHSVGTFANKDKMCTTSFNDEVPKTQAPSAPKPPSSRRVRMNRNVSDPSTSNINIASAATMDDILVVTTRQSELGILWVNYLKACFDKITKQRGRLSFNFLHVKIDEEKITSDLIQRCLSTKLQICIICPSLLSLAPGFIMQQLSPLLKPERVIGMLLDVTEAQVWGVHKDTFPSYKQWRRCVVRNHDQSFVSDLIGIATDILGRALRQRPYCNDTMMTTTTTTPTSSHSSIQNNTISGKHHENFTVIPRKIKIGQNKATVMLNEPLNKDDWIKIKIEKVGHTFEITNIKRRNPYTIHFTVPESCMEISMMIGIRIIKNNVDLGVRPIKCESRLREIEQLLKSQDAPIEFMCQAMGVTTTDRDKLDHYMVQSFQKNIPPNYYLLASHLESSNSMRMNRESSQEEYPTLLHFAARWGFEHLCLFLLDCPGAEMACELKNIAGKTPAEMAEMYGFYKLSNSFRNYSKMHEFTTMYHYFKGISDSTPEKSIIELKTEVVKKEMSQPPEQVDEMSEDDHPEEYLEMNGSGSEPSDSNNNDSTFKALTKENAVANLNYLNVTKELAIEETFDCVDSAIAMSIEMKVMKKHDSTDMLNNLNDLKIKEEDEKEIDQITNCGELTNELKISEPKYYDSNELNKVGDDFSNECSDVLDNCSSNGTDTASLTPSTNSVPSTETNQVPVKIQEEDYLIQPSNKPVSSEFGDYLTQPSNRPLTKYNNVQVMQHDYMNQPTSQSKIKRDREVSHLRLYFKKKSDSFNDDDGCGYAKIHELHSPTKSMKSVKSTKSTGTLKRQDSDISKKSVDDELLEIINDFKNNVFTIQEVEELVSTWKNRNDVKKSFTDKQEQLQKMREEYERIQDKMNYNLKRPSPFERMKRLFSRKNDRESSKAASESSDFQTNRPVSSTLSLNSASSTSSGRMSTSSQVSQGDSGTHSDHDERRHHNGCNTSVYRIGHPGSLMDNYLIPPAPRPISTASTPNDNIYFPSNSRNFNPIDTPEHYIMFPSNMPVFPTPPSSSSIDNTFSTFKGNN